MGAPGTTEVSASPVLDFRCPVLDHPQNVADVHAHAHVVAGDRLVVAGERLLVAVKGQAFEAIDMLGMVLLRRTAFREALLL